ncbi:MAG: autotransporter outer membrane beta-barrel domain-containing protein [Rhodospirillales bacterium]|nr:autotransporter outer membrane beta-barrel domain-containing protein [Rhodospirillales bacterium]
MTKNSNGVFRRSLLAGVALSCLMALTPQTAMATLDNTLVAGSAALISKNNRVLTNIYMTAMAMRILSFVNMNQGRPVANGSAMYQEVGTGVAAGDESKFANVSLFTSLSYTGVDDSFSGGAYDSDTISVSYGGDYAVGEKLIVGLSGGYADTDSDTKFNAGRTQTGTWTVSPYAAYIISDLFSIDVSGGYSGSDAENRRLAGAVRVTGDQDSDSHFFSVNGRVSKWYNNIGLNGNVGYTYSRSKTDSMTESNATFVASAKNTFEQLQVGGQISYYTERYMPCFGFSYQNELGKANLAGTSSDDDEVVLTQGVSLYGSSRFKACRFMDRADSRAA